MGTGTGINLPLYGPGARVTGCDVSGEMLARVARRRAQSCASLIQADIQRLPFADGSFDVVAASLVLCSVADPARALAKVRRALRPGGHLVLLEHTRGNGLGDWLTDTFHPLWRAWSRECHNAVPGVTENVHLTLRAPHRLGKGGDSPFTFCFNRTTILKEDEIDM